MPYHASNLYVYLECIERLLSKYKHEKFLEALKRPLWIFIYFSSLWLKVWDLLSPQYSIQIALVALQGGLRNLSFTIACQVWIFHTNTSHFSCEFVKSRHIASPEGLSRTHGPGQLMLVPYVWAWRDHGVMQHSLCNLTWTTRRQHGFACD